MNKIKHCFDKAANSYDKNAHLQNLVGKQLIELVQKYQSTTHHVIDLGCGTGLVTEQLAKSFSWHDFHAIDFSKQSLRIARHRLTSLGVSVYQANFDTFSHPTMYFDLVFSNMALHWSTQLKSTLKQIATLLSDDGIFVFTLPLMGSFIELQGHFSLQRFLTLLQIKNFISHCQLTLLYTFQENSIIFFNDLLTALRSIKAVGTNHVEKRLHHGLRGKAFLNQIDLKKLTYVIGYFVVSKKNQ